MATEDVSKSGGAGTQNTLSSPPASEGFMAMMKKSIRGDPRPPQPSLNVETDNIQAMETDDPDVKPNVPSSVSDDSFFSVFKRGAKEPVKKPKSMQSRDSVVNIVLVKAKNLLAMYDNGLSDPYVKFKLGTEKYKSKVKPKTTTPKWLEQFSLHMFTDQTCSLEMSVWNYEMGGKDEVIGRATIDLSVLDHEVTHTIKQNLRDDAGIVTILLTISGISSSESVTDLANYKLDPVEHEELLQRYGLVKTFTAFKDIGWLQVKVIKGEGLLAADINGKSDPFCVIELVNTRLQTHTEYKTLNPEWGKVFTYNVKDIHSNLEITVWDEDSDKKADFLGKLCIPLLRIKNGERKWYVLKDKKLMGRTKGAIQLEMAVIFNPFRAAIRTFDPREDKYMQPDPKFKISAMKRNIDRVSKIADAAVETGKFIQSCFDWDSKARTVVAFAVYLTIVWNFELYMLPLALLCIFFKNLLVVQVVGSLLTDKAMDEYVDEDDDDDDEKEREEKKSFKEKLQAIQDVCLQVQEGMDMVASLGERVKNSLNWTVPWLSWLAVIVLTIATVILYNVSLRTILLVWGINKFTKKLRAPNAIPNNELLDYLSRVPSDKELFQARELRPEAGIGINKKKRN